VIKNFAGKVLNKNKNNEKMINGNTLVQNYINQTNPTNQTNIFKNIFELPSLLWKSNNGS
jgi:hypothetical protein